MQATYLDVIALVELRHRQFLEAVALELDGHGVRDINCVQAMILYNVGAMDMEMTVGELTQRGCYLGSNVSYNLKKMVTNGYIVQDRSPHDRRSIRVRLTEKGRALWAKIHAMHQRHVAAPSRRGVPTTEELVQAHKTLHRLERFWSQSVEFGSRNQAFTSAT